MACANSVGCNRSDVEDYSLSASLIHNEIR